MSDAEIRPKRRITILAIFLMILVSLFDLTVLAGSFILWLPTSLVAIGTQIGELTEFAVFLLLAGPVFSLIGLIGGWIGFLFSPRIGLLIGLLVPLAWLIAIFVLTATGEGRCSGGFC